MQNTQSAGPTRLPGEYISVAMRRLPHHSCLAEVSYPLGIFYLEEAALSNPS